MGKDSNITWCHHTFNAWWGCAHYSELCDFCYAERFDAYVHSKNPHWGVKADRLMMSEKHWQQPLAWNEEAKRLGIRYRVFCSSMADVFEKHPQVTQARIRLFELIKKTPYLDWQLLTKRYDRIREFLPDDWGDGYDNVWGGTSVGLQKRVNQYLPEFMDIPFKVRFLSCEPLLGEIDLSPYLETGKISWVITGGESGFGKIPNDPNVKFKYRECNLEWIEKIVTQCKTNDVPVFVKQLGTHLAREMKLVHKTGADINEFPKHLQIQQFPIKQVA